MTDSNSADGGNLIIHQQDEPRALLHHDEDTLTVRGGCPAGDGRGGDICFQLPDCTEAFRIEADGAVFIKGERCGYDAELYQAMRAFFVGARAVES